MNDVERLLAIEAIKRTKARYYRTMDTKDWEGFAAVFTPDAELDMRAEDAGGGGLVTGNRAIADYVRGSVDHVLTVHHGHMPEIESQWSSTGPTSAASAPPAGAPEVRAMLFLVGHCAGTFFIQDRHRRATVA